MADSVVVELRDLEKSFRAPNGIVPAVRGVDLVIRAGEVVALLGPNGAGKSTTIDMLLGLAEPDAGRARVLGSRASGGDRCRQGRRDASDGLADP